MNRMQKNAIYDEMCGLLTRYEDDVNSSNGELDKETAQYYEEDFYTMLVKIQNNWEYLTGDEDE